MNLQIPNVTKSLVASHKGATKLTAIAVSDVVMILQQSNGTKSLVASHKGATKLTAIAVNGVEMIQCRLSSGSHSATLLDGTFKFALLVVAIEMMLQNLVILELFASVTLGAYQLICVDKCR